MRLLLDTHAALSVVSEPDALSPIAREAIVGAEEIRLSVVSPWELSIKSALEKIILHRTVEEICRELEREFAVQCLAVTLAHVLEVGRLAPHHGDPFDRLLIAQAKVEGLTLVTRDQVFADYGVALVKASDHLGYLTRDPSDPSARQRAPSAARGQYRPLRPTARRAPRVEEYSAAMTRSGNPTEAEVPDIRLQG
jgi:PIN domain nuclease of toxin-antitoxin system